MKLKLLCTALLVAVTAGIAAAQGDAQALILSAYENTQALETFVYESESVVAQAMGMGGGMTIDTETTVSTNTRGQRVGDAINLASSSQTSIGSMMGAMGFGFELIYVDGVLWARSASDTPAVDASGADNPMAGMMGDVFADMFPTEWTNITEAPDAYPSLSVYTNPELILPQLTDSAGLYALSEAVLATAEELPSEEIDGRSVRVFQFTANPGDLSEEARAAIDSAIAAAAQSGGGAAAGMGDMSAMMDGMFEDMVENMLITVTLYIDEAENLVVQSVIEQETTMNMDMQGMEIAIDQTSTTTSRLVEYNTDIVIEAPVR